MEEEDASAEDSPRPNQAAALLRVEPERLRHLDDGDCNRDLVDGEFVRRVEKAEIASLDTLTLPPFTA